MEQVVFKPQRYAKITTAAAHAVISATELGAFLRLPSALVTAETSILDANIALATEIVENYTWTTLRETTFSGYFSHIYPYIQIDTSPITASTSILSINYLEEADDGDIAYTTYDLGDSYTSGSYENADIKITGINFANITLRNLDAIEVVSRLNQYPLYVSYKAGYPYDVTTSKYLLPQSLRMAILQLASRYYTDRGDCVGCVNAGGYFMPASVKMLLDPYSLQSIALGVDDSELYVGTSYNDISVV